MGELPHRPNDIQGRGVAGAAWWVRTLSGVVLFALVLGVMLAAISLLIVGPMGCSYAPLPNGQGGVLGIPIGEDGTVAPGLGGDMLTTLLVAGGAAVGVPGVGGIALLINRFMRAITDRAELKGREEGWTEREAAASIQAPLPGPVAYGGGGAGPDRSGVSVTETVVKT